MKTNKPEETFSEIINGFYLMYGLISGVTTAFMYGETENSHTLSLNHLLPVKKLYEFKYLGEEAKKFLEVFVELVGVSFLIDLSPDRAYNVKTFMEKLAEQPLSYTSAEKYGRHVSAYCKYLLARSD